MSNPIDFFVSYYGTSPYKDIILTWGGSATSFTLREVGNATALYTGSGTTYTVLSSPNTRHDYTLTAVVGGVTYTATALTYTTALPAPSGLTSSAVTSSSATISWGTVLGVTSYEIADATNSYTVVHTTTSGSWNLTGLTASTRHSYAVRSVYGAYRSSWSPAITFFTPAAASTTGVFEYAPSSVYVWAAGKAGSTSPQWLPVTSGLYAGEGTVWGDNNGVQTTFFFYGSPSQFTSLAGSTCTKCEVYLERGGPSGDPGVVLSRWGLHRYYTKPIGAPDDPAATVDVGAFTKEQSGWVTLPSSWGQQLINNVWGFGISWGGTSERYMSALRPSYVSTPAIGCLRLTVA